MSMYDRLPHFVYLRNEKYFINTDYRIFIKFEEGAQGKNSKQVINDCLIAFYPDFFYIQNKGLLKEAIDEFILFYKCGKKDVKTKQKSGKNEKNGIFSYSFDDQLIWSAYYSQYRVDLTTIKLHWWKFKSMWLSLNSECEFCKRKGYRAYNGKDKELLELKEIYKIPPDENEINEKERLNKIYDSLKK